jgi:flagellar hook assembly protein FlgD
VTVGVYDASGRNVRSLFTGSAEAGQHTVAWDGRDAQNRKVAPGVYSVRVMGTKEQTTSRITFLRY